MFFNVKFVFSMYISELCKRMWTCMKCSYAYNVMWTDRCEICTCPRSPPSLSQPSLITVTKEENSSLSSRPKECLQVNKLVNLVSVLFIF